MLITNEDDLLAIFSFYCEDRGDSVINMYDLNFIIAQTQNNNVYATLKYSKLNLGIQIINMNEIKCISL
jgi:hypothetical protein